MSAVCQCHSPVYTVSSPRSDPFFSDHDLSIYKMKKKRSKSSKLMHSLLNTFLQTYVSTICVICGYAYIKRVLHLVENCIDVSVSIFSQNIFTQNEKEKFL